MEELNASPSPLLSTTVPSSHDLTSNIIHQRRHHRNDVSGGGDRQELETPRMVAAAAAAEAGGDTPSSPADDDYNSASSNNDGGDGPTLATRRSFSQSTMTMQQRRRQRQHQPLPFVFPITHSGATYCHAAHLWTTIQGWIDLRIGNLGGIRRAANYTSIATTSAPMPNSTRPSSSMMLLSSTLNNRLHAESIANIDFQGADEEVGENLCENADIMNTQSPASRTSSSSSSSSSFVSDGLRRRSNSRQDHTADYGGSGLHQHHDNLASQLTSSNRRGADSSIEGDIFPPSMPNLSISQRGEQHLHNDFGHRQRRGGGSSRSSSLSRSNEDLSSHEDITASSSSESTSSSSDDDLIARSSQRVEDTDETYNRVGGINDHDYQGGGCSQRNVYIVMRLSFAIAVFHIFVLISLHCTYVGPYAFRGWQQKQQYGDGTTNNDMLVNCISYALSTRPIKERSNYFGVETKDYPSDGNDVVERRLSDETGADSDEQEWSYLKNTYDQAAIAGIGNATKSDAAVFSPLLGKDEILQIKIVWKNCIGKCSKVRVVEYPVQLDAERSDNSTYEGTSLIENTNDSLSGRRVLSNVSEMQEDKLLEAELSSPSYWEKVHYRFSMDDALLHLDEMSVYLHNITLVNVTLTERCLSSGSDLGM